MDRNKNVPHINDMRKKIQQYSYPINALIGKGHSSSVYIGNNDNTKQKVAIKAVSIKQMDPIRKQYLGQQLKILGYFQKVNHINIIKLLATYSTVNNCYIITQFCNQGDLHNLLKKRQILPQVQATNIFRDIINGYRVIYQHGYIHRDLKPQNILIKDKIARIADFGFAKKISKSGQKQPITIGSPYYMSPQALKYNTYTTKNDIWALGVILYQMLHGKTPWQGITNQGILRQKMQKKQIKLANYLSQQIKQFIKSCLQPQESKRLGPKQFFGSIFIKRIANVDHISPLLRKNTTQNPYSQKQIAKQRNPYDIKSQHKIPNYGRKLTPDGSRPKTQKWYTNYIMFMRFIYRYLKMFSQTYNMGDNTKGLYFTTTKLLLSLYHSLTEILKQKKQQKIFNLQGWEDFVANNQKSQYYSKILNEYGNRYQQNRKQYQKLIPIVKEDKRLAQIANTNYTRCQLLNILAIKYSIQQCKNLWNQLENIVKKLKITNKNSSSQFQKISQKLDFTITFYQLNCLQIDHFDDPDYFFRNSKLDVIIQNQPAPFSIQMIEELHMKLKLLELIQ